MKANELRIGNTIFNSREEKNQIVNLFILDSLIKQNSDYKPIPLTEDWLLKFDFTLKSDVDGEYYEKNGVKVLILRSDNIIFFFGSPNNKEKYVHELQNYYFVMTGKELDIHLK